MTKVSSKILEKHEYAHSKLTERVHYVQRSRRLPARTNKPLSCDVHADYQLGDGLRHNQVHADDLLFKLSNLDYSSEQISHKGIIIICIKWS